MKLSDESDSGKQYLDKEAIETSSNSSGDDDGDENSLYNHGGKMKDNKTQSRKELIQSNKTQSVTRIFLKFIMNVNEVNCSTSQTTVKKRVELLSELSKELVRSLFDVDFLSEANTNQKKFFRYIIQIALRSTKKSKKDKENDTLMDTQSLVNLCINWIKTIIFVEETLIQGVLKSTEDLLDNLTFIEKPNLLFEPLVPNIFKIQNVFRFCDVENFLIFLKADEFYMFKREKLN